MERKVDGWSVSWLPAAAVLFFWTAALAAQGPRFDRLEHLSTEHGLSHDWILALHQDREGFLWIGTDDGLNRYDGYRFEVYRADPEDPATLASNIVTAIFEDSRGDLWVGTVAGLHRFDRRHESFRRFVHDPERGDSHPRVADLAEDRFGSLWVATANGSVDRLDDGGSLFARYALNPEGTYQTGAYDFGRVHVDRAGQVWATGSGLVLHRYERSEDRFEAHPLSNGDSDEDTGVAALADASGGRLWIGTAGGRLLRFDPLTLRHESFPTGRPHGLRSLLPRPDGSLWIGTEYGGLLVLDPAQSRFSVFEHDPEEPGSLSHDRVQHIVEDHTGIVWLGTDLGLDKFVPSRERFTLYRHKPSDPDSLSGNFVKPIREDRRGLLWVGTEGAGLNRLDLRRGVNTRFVHDPGDPASLGSNTALDLFEDSSGDFWVGTDSGVDRFDAERGSFEPLQAPADDADNQLVGAVYAIAESRDATLWIGGTQGLWSFDKAAGRLRHLRHGVEYPGNLGKVAVYDLLVDRRDDLWLGTHHGGLGRLDAQRQGFRQFLHDPEDPHSLRHDLVTLLHEDRAGDLWIGAFGSGLDRYDAATGRFVHYGEAQGLPDPYVLSLLEDGEGRFWLSHHQGLTRWDPRTGDARTYASGDGLPAGPLSFHSAWQSADGEMFFGSHKGMSSFFPEQLEDDRRPPRLALTDFQVLNRSTPLGDRLSEDGTRLVLGYRDDVFGFEFSALHYKHPAANRYSYRLEGFQDEWVETGARQRFAQYTNLDPGDYTFRVKAANADGVWNDAGMAVELTVLPAPWQTWWARSLYGLALAALAAAYVGSQRAKLRRERLAAEREREVNVRLRQVDKFRDEFLANTSHELRTPLYGITGLVESLLDGSRGKIPEAARKDLEVVVANGQRLSALVEDILDFSKIRREGFLIERRPVDLRSLTDVVLALSRPLAAGKDLELRNAVDADLPPADANENRLQQILCNLVGNAVKFTPSGWVEVRAHVDEDHLVVSVVDTGIGISEEEQQRIFQAFKQADSSTERIYGGTGLGLAITHQLVELHGGEIEVCSIPGEGSVFSFTLAISDEPPQEAEPPVVARLASPVPAVTPAGEGEEGEELYGTDQPYILVVDDEPVVRRVLLNQLRSQGFRVAQAPNGPAALEKVAEAVPDLVLLDVMMPRMSGYEVCRQLRQHHAIEELPVIFLTAKSNVEDLVVGLTVGANDYLPKPISKTELLSRVKIHLDLLGKHRRVRWLNEGLETRNAEMARFNYTMAHDLKNPVVTIKNFLGSLKQDLAGGRTDRLAYDLACLEEASEKMRRMLDELFQFSRLGCHELVLVATDLGSLVSEVLEELGELADERSIEVEVEAGLPSVHADRGCLREMLRHLLANAICYMGAQPAPRVEIGTAPPTESSAGNDLPAAGEPVFFVRDNGMGIDSRYHEKVFDLFEQLDPQAGEGTGIGLALARRIVEHHGGRIWVESAGAGTGSTFYFTLPLASAPQPTLEARATLCRR